MLELECLKLGPWLPPSASSRDRKNWQRLIADSNSGARAGVALWQPRVRQRWLRLLSPAIVEIRESDDEPLLLTGRKVWTPLPRWEIHDADDRTVGSVSASWLLDAHRHRAAAILRPPTGSCIEFQSAEGESLAILSGRGEQQLQFAARVADEPFLKMLLVAAAVILP